MHGGSGSAGRRHRQGEAGESVELRVAAELVQPLGSPEQPDEAALVATAGFVAVQSSGAPSAEAAVSSAADAMGAVTSLEGELTSSTPGASDGTTRIRVDEADLEIVGEIRDADGHIEGSTSTVVDGTGYETIEGRTTSALFGPDGGLAPFGASSEAVVAAALEGSDVSDGGEEVLDGVTTTRYDLELTDASIAALSALTPSELARFELEHPEDVEALSVWVADDCVHQVEIAHRDRLTRTRFFNFNGDITITAPPGPYGERDDG